MLAGSGSAGSRASPPALVLTRPDRPAGRGRDSPRRRSPRPRARSDSSWPSPRASTIPHARVDRRARTRCGGRVRVRCAHQGAAALRLRDAQRAPLAASALAWRCADRASHHGRRRETGVSIMRLTAGLDSGPVCLTASEPICARGHLRFACRAARASSGVNCCSTPSSAGSWRGAAVRRAGRGRRHLCREDGPADRLLDPCGRPSSWSALYGLCTRTSARVSRCPTDSLLGVQRAALARLPAAEGEGVARWRWLAVLDCVQGRLELLEVQPPGKRPMEADAFLRGHGLPQREQAHSGRTAADAVVPAAAVTRPAAAQRGALRKRHNRVRTRCAYAVLRRVFEQGAYADRALHAEAASSTRATVRLRCAWPTARSNDRARSTM